MKQISFFSDFKDPAVDWIFNFLSTALGCRFYPVTEPNLASIIYSNFPAGEGQLRIPIWHGYYDKTEEHYLHSSGFWVPRNIKDNQLSIDFIGLIFRLLNLVDEIALPNDARDQLGNLSPNIKFPRSEFRHRPVVDEVVQIFKQNLVELNLLLESELLSRWPEGKRYAVLITHDTDGPCLLETKELAKAGIKGLVKRNRPERQAFFEGCHRRITGNTDPYFNFAHWADFEQLIGATSAFYIYVKSKGVPSHIHNPLYQVNKSAAKWNILHELTERGWEIGLHASIHALINDKYIQAEKQNLEGFLGRSIAGNRCHYWCINWRDPVESFRRLESTGMIYDCSIAWKDSPGFRSGTTIPYHPYDCLNRRGLKLLEIPTNLMDGHLFQYQFESNPFTWFTSVLEQVRTHSGVLNLDWHTRTWVDKFSYAGWRSFIVQELRKLADTGEAWFTTPRNLSEFWLTREQKIEK